MRVTGAQRLAWAGVSEHKIAVFGRWSSSAFRLCVREAVLGCQGGDLAQCVERSLTDEKMQKQVRAVSGGAHGLGLAARDDFTRNAVANPSEKITSVEWRAFSAELARELKAAAARPLPKFCTSDQGVGHKIVCARYTACGWHWSRTACQTANEGAITCRKCSGASIRWGVGIP